MRTPTFAALALGLCLCVDTLGGAHAAGEVVAPPAPPAAGAPAPAPPAPSAKPPDAASPAPAQNRDLFAVLVVAAVFGATAFGLLTIRKSLLNSAWSLSDALSEDVEVTGDPPAGGAAPPTVKRLVASTSRFIAMLGLVAILMMFIGFGLVVLYDFALTGKPPEKDDVVALIYFLTSGLTLFAPYAVNKVAAAVS